MGYLSKLPVIRRGGQNRQYYLICPAPLAAALEMEKGETLEPQICVKGHWEHGKTPVEMDLLSHKYSPATFHPAGEKLPNGHLCNLSLQNLNIGEQETLIHAFLRFKAIMLVSSSVSGVASRESVTLCQACAEFVAIPHNPTWTT